MSTWRRRCWKNSAWRRSAEPRRRRRWNENGGTEAAVPVEGVVARSGQVAHQPAVGHRVAGAGAAVAEDAVAACVTLQRAPVALPRRVRALVRATPLQERRHPERK